MTWALVSPMLEVSLRCGAALPFTPRTRHALFSVAHPISIGPSCLICGCICDSQHSAGAHCALVHPKRHQHRVTDPRELQVSFMSIMFLSLGAMPQLNAVTMSKPVFFKQRDNLFFAPCMLPCRYTYYYTPSTGVVACDPAIVCLARVLHKSASTRFRERLARGSSCHSERSTVYLKAAISWSAHGQTYSQALLI